MIGYRQTGTRTANYVRQTGWADILPGARTPKRQYDKPPLPCLSRAECREMEEADEAEDAKISPKVPKPRMAAVRCARAVDAQLSKKCRKYALAVWRATTEDGDVRKWKCYDGESAAYAAEFGLTFTQAGVVRARLGIMPCRVGNIRYFPGDMRERIDVEYPP